MIISLTTVAATIFNEIFKFFCKFKQESYLFIIHDFLIFSLNLILMIKKLKFKYAFLCYATTFVALFENQKINKMEAYGDLPSLWDLGLKTALKNIIYWHWKAETATIGNSINVPIRFKIVK